MFKNCNKLRKITCSEDSFNYFMNHIIKRLSGEADAHTRYLRGDFIPFIFKIIENKVLVSYPENLLGYELTSINDIPINKIIEDAFNEFMINLPNLKEVKFPSSPDENIGNIHIC